MSLKRQIKIIIIGPFPDPISGVSLSNKKVKDTSLQARQKKRDVL